MKLALETRIGVIVLVIVASITLIVIF